MTNVSLREAFKAEMCLLSCTAPPLRQSDSSGAGPGSALLKVTPCCSGGLVTKHQSFKWVLLLCELNTSAAEAVDDSAWKQNSLVYL